MDNIFEPVKPIGTFKTPSAEYQVNIDPASDLGDADVLEEPTDEQPRSLKHVAAVFGLLLLILGVRLVKLQVTQSRAFRILAKGNSIETRLTLPPRGAIVDHKGRDLVKNSPIYSLEIYPAQLPRNKAARQAIYDKISQVSGIANTDIANQVQSKGLSSIDSIALKDNLDRDTALSWQVKLGALSGVSINTLANRTYDTTTGLSHLLGYVGKVSADDKKSRPDLLSDATVGRAGLEEYYDDQLQGQVGKEQVEVDAKGQIQRTVSDEPALPGDTLQLYLDKDLQTEMAQDLQDGITAAGKTKGVAIAMDPRNGGILAMVSIPSYDNNAFSQPDRSKDRQAYLKDPNQPLFDRAVAGAYPPGSTSKPIWAASALDNGEISESTDIQTPPEIKVGTSTFPDWEPHGHSDVRKAIAQSNNIFFYALAGGYDKIKGLGADLMKQYAERFGWGAKTGIDLPGEGVGLLPDPGWKKSKLKQPWYIGDTYHQGIGQGYLTLTPIELVDSIAAIANGGTLYQPHLVSSVTDVNGKTTPVDPIATRKNFIDPHALQVVREGMRETVTGGSDWRGTSTPLRDLPIAVAGKTGTAQFTGLDASQTHAWFVGFAPYDKPDIVVLVMVENGGESFTVAVPIAKKILAWYSIHEQDVHTDNTPVSSQ